MEHTKTIYTLGGGTFNHVRSHLALAAPAFGETARMIHDRLVRENFHIPPGWEPKLVLTKMADHTSKLVTNADVENYVDTIIADTKAKIVFFNVALCDFKGSIDGVQGAKYATRLKSREGEKSISLEMANKLIGKLRKTRKDIFLIAFKTTAGATESEQYLAGLNLLKENSCNLVLANDVVTRTNMIIVPEEAQYCVTRDRDVAIRTLVHMAISRSKLSFTRSTVVPGDTVDWNGPDVPATLREVVNHCIARGAYKPFRGSTAGHFAYKVDERTFVTSKRKTNYNNLDQVGLVKVVSDGPDSVIAYGAKPSVGGQSQRIVFAEHEDVDCIVHFHSPLKEYAAYLPDPTKNIVRRPQQFLECGSHECGKNTSDGLALMEPGIRAVFLDNHGPNIVFNRNVDPKRVIAFIERNFELSAKTGGLVA